MSASLTATETWQLERHQPLGTRWCSAFPPAIASARAMRTSMWTSSLRADSRRARKFGSSTGTYLIFRSWTDLVLGIVRAFNVTASWRKCPLTTAFRRPSRVATRGAAWFVGPDVSTPVLRTPGPALHGAVVRSAAAAGDRLKPAFADDLRSVLDKPAPYVRKGATVAFPFGAESTSSWYTRQKSLAASSVLTSTSGVLRAISAPVIVAAIAWKSGVDMDHPLALWKRQPTFLSCPRAAGLPRCESATGQTSGFALQR